MKFSIKITPSSAVHFKVILKKLSQIFISTLLWGAASLAPHLFSLFVRDHSGRVKYVFREVYYFAEYLSASTFNYLILLVHFL